MRPTSWFVELCLIGFTLGARKGVRNCLRRAHCSTSTVLDVYSALLLTLLRLRTGAGAKSSFDLRRLSLRIMRAAANAMLATCWSTRLVACFEITCKHTTHAARSIQSHFVRTTTTASHSKKLAPTKQLRFSQSIVFLCGIRRVGQQAVTGRSLDIRAAAPGCRDCVQWYRSSCVLRFVRVDYCEHADDNIVTVHWLSFCVRCVFVCVCLSNTFLMMKITLLERATNSTRN